MSFLKSIRNVLSQFTEANIRAAHLAQLSSKTDTELQRMGLNRKQLVHAAFSGNHYS